MSREIDERIVSMEFNNGQFERNINTSMGSIEKLKQSLNFSGVAKGFSNIDSAANRVNLFGISNAVDSVGLKFNAMYTIADQAFRNITNSAMAAGKRIVSALTIDPIKTGLSEYETQIGAVQTILANTESKGTTLQDVNGALDELNTYADKTIYNFTEMTRNIGTFTAAGVDLDKSVSSIKGIANLAAVSGSTSQQASTAMYQLSQALAAGKVQLMDWNSVVNAGMGGQVFQDALKRTATQMGTNVDAMIKKYGSFRESLTKGEWLTAEVLTETLTQLSGAYTEADLIAKGYTEKQAADIVKLAETAVNAATKVKTATQLWDTLKEAAQSGWTQTWEIVIGDFEEAKELWTTISDSIGGLINSASEARNTLLAGGLSSGWKQLLGAGISDETGFQESIRSVLGDDKKFKWKALSITFDELIKKTGSFDKAISHALKNGDMSSADLTKSVSTLADKIRGMSVEERKAAGITADHVKEIEALEKGLKDGSISMDEFVKKMTRPSGRENLIDSLFNTAKALMSVVKPIGDAFKEIFPSMESEQLYQFTVRLKEFTEKLTLSEDKADKVKRAFKGLFSIFDMGRKVITAIIKPLAELAGSDGIGSLADLVLDAAAGLGDFFTNLNKGFNTNDISGTLSNIAATISDVIGATSEDLRDFGKILQTVGEWIGKGLGWIWNGFKEVFGWIADNVSAGDIFAGLVGGGLFAALKKLAGLFDKVSEAVEGLFGKGDNEGGIKEKFGDLLDGVKDSLASFSTGVRIGSIVAVAIAVGILSASLNSISKLEVKDITKSLFTIGSMMAMLSLTFRSMTKSISTFDSKGIVKSSFALIFVASAIKILASAMEKIGKLSLKDIAKGLIGIGGGLAELSIGLKYIGKTKVSLSTSIAMLALAESCNILGDAMAKFSKLSWDEIGRGLTGMGGALGELVIALGVLSKVGGGGALLGSAGIFITVQSLGKLADSLKKFGTLSWDEIKRGLTAMGGALGELVIALGVLGKVGGFSSLFASGAILTVVHGMDDLAVALKQFGSMTWDEIKRGLVGMGGALGEVATITGVLGKLTGLSGLLGAGSILTAVQSLGDLADALKKFGGMTWDEIEKGLTGMGGALGEVAIISGGLGALTGLAGIFGGAAIWTSVQGLGDLADALKKFGEMNWDEIGRGLTAMGSALGEIALGGLLNTLSIIGSYSISEMAEPLGVLADSLKKWKDVTVPEGLGWKLGQLASGLMTFTLAGFGASALATAAPAVGTMADSVKKWAGVTVPEGLGAQIGSLADGIEEFTFALVGSGALSLAAPAIGQMADSLKKWKDVTIPAGLEAGLKQIANGVEAFTFSLAGGWSMSALVTPLGELAGSVQKWSGVTIPDGLEAGLKQIANGVNAFSFAFLGGWSISAIIQPLIDLSGAVSKWNNVTIPDNIETNLKSLANGVKSFSFAFVGGWSISTIVDPLKDLAGAVKKWNNVAIASDLGDKLKSLASGYKKFTGLSDISTTINNIKNLRSAISKFSDIDFSSITSNLSGFSKSVKDLGSIGSSLSNFGKDLVGALVASIENGKGRVQSAVKSLAMNAINGFNSTVVSMQPVIASNGTAMISALTKGVTSGTTIIMKAISSIMTNITRYISDRSISFKALGQAIGNYLSSGITNSSPRIRSAVASSLSSAAGTASGYYSSFYNAGTYVASGFAAGISANTWMAEARASAMAYAAAQAARSALKINSPSKVFEKIAYSIPEGAAKGIDKLAYLMSDSSIDMARGAIDGVKNAISSIADIASSDVNLQPTISPVLDLSNVNSGVGAINSLLNLTPSVGVMANVGAINSMMNRRQNGDEEVVNAINKLRKGLDNVGNTTYTVGNITYDDGSNVSNAVKELIRAARVERRI